MNIKEFNFEDLFSEDKSDHLLVTFKIESKKDFIEMIKLFNKDYFDKEILAIYFGFQEELLNDNIDNIEFVYEPQYYPVIYQYDLKLYYIANINKNYIHIETINKINLYKLDENNPVVENYFIDDNFKKENYK